MPDTQQLFAEAILLAHARASGYGNAVADRALVAFTDRYTDTLWPTGRAILDDWDAQLAATT